MLKQKGKESCSEPGVDYIKQTSEYMYVYKRTQKICTQDKFLFTFVSLLKLKVICVGTFAEFMALLIDL